MKKFNYSPKGVCARNIEFEIDDDGRLRNVSFLGGCDGNLKGVSKLLEGMDASQAALILKGNDCRGRGTSCLDQFSKAVEDAFKNIK